MNSIRINIARQSLELKDGSGKTLRSYAVSTAKNGVGERNGSFCTPRGRHIVRAKIGRGVPENTVFVARRPTGECYTAELGEQFPGRDWILTRILWLSGVEEGKNKGGNVDSHERYIYIHGSPDDIEMGCPGSRGCVRMRNGDVIELFDLVYVGTKVLINDN